jgi:hypothetical protein
VERFEYVKRVREREKEIYRDRERRKERERKRERSTIYTLQEHISSVTVACFNYILY